MKKSIKKIISLVIAMALTISGITYSTVAKADESEGSWKTDAVKVPSEGQLVGAGYIDVEFDNSMEGYTYTVYLDGKPVYWNGNDIVREELGEKKTDDSVTKTFTSSDEGKTEVYATTVSKHEITVKAKKDNVELTSVRNFYVSKKGLALGGDMSDKIKLSKLNCSWYYNWSTEAFNKPLDKGVQHIPMMWGSGDDNKEAMKNLVTTSNYILGFNEPDIGSQANMQFFEAVDIWNQYIKPLNLRKVSPAPAAPGGDSVWLKRFIRGDYICKNPWDGSWGLYYDYEDDATKKWIEGENEDVDAVSLHYYRNVINLQGLIEAVDTLWNLYHKPIWITEMSLFGRKGTEYDFSYENEEKRAEIQKYLEGAMEALDANPHVERYCWFSYDIDSSNDIDSSDGSGGTAMFDYTSGAYTELGRMYSSKGNPEGYNTETISDDEMFVYVPETTTPETTTPETTAKLTTSETETKNNITNKQEKSATKTVLLKQVKIKKAKNVKKKSVKIAWNKVAKAKKYQVQYAMNSKFTKKVKIKTTNKLTYTVKKLQKKKKYYFRVRAVLNGINGKWSKTRKVIIKK
ncbi:hypothetical protein DW018_04845 [Eubacterium ventriosum]|uniref:Fibronectin type-III domain-containing protein n=1 Tax=Eubacterium ventriosum TaxID=39496 RepID=A0A415LDU0_9FIRM|nr:glycosyl hydrolase [Eubacterium ventriosum]RHL46514.1 hypothetical protein DW018_04845 [Eubacterium ventriosum]